METVTTLSAGQDIEISHGRLHPEVTRATLVEDFNPGDTYCKVIFNDSRPYTRPLVLSHRHNLVRLLPSVPRDYNTMRPVELIPTTKTVTKTTKRTRKTK